jgi:hypothetical protein
LTQDFDYLWSQLRDNYAYFDRKQTDWHRVREIYRPRLAGVRNKREFITLLERVLEELYDPHTHLKINTLPNTKIRLNYAAEKLFHLNGTPREDFVPPVAVKLSDQRTDDAILATGLRTLRGLLKRRPQNPAARGHR